MKKARVIYNEEYDAFDIELLSNGEWELSNRYLCKTAEQCPTVNTVYIHFSILRKIADLQHMGYKVSIEV